MKRFIITNNHDGLKFIVEADELPSLQPPEWGVNPTIFEEDITEEYLSRPEKSKAQIFLDATDWYVIRETETGVPCPPHIKSARQAAREKI
jgi:hypothetical protein